MRYCTRLVFFLSIVISTPLLLKGQQDGLYFARKIDSLSINELPDAAMELALRWAQQLEQSPNVIDNVWQKAKIMKLSREKDNSTTDTAYSALLELLRERNGEFTLAYIDILADYAMYYYQKGQYSQSADMMNNVVQRATVLLKETDTYLLKFKNELAFLLIDAGKPEEGGEIVESVLRTAKEQGLDQTPLYLYTLRMRGDYLLETGKIEQSLDAYRAALQLAEDLSGKESKKYWESLFSYCKTLIATDRFEEIIPLLDEEKRLNDLLFGRTTSTNRMISVQLRGTVLSNMKMYEECIATYEEGKKIAEETSGKRSQFYAVCSYYIGLSNDGLNRYEQAEESFITAIQIMTERAKGNMNLYLALFKLGRAQMLVRWGHYEESLAEIKEIEEFFENQKNTLYYYYFQQAKADLLFARGQLSEGFQICDDVIAAAKETYGPNSDIEVTFLEKKMKHYYDARQYDAVIQPLEAYSEVIKNNYIYKYPFLSDAQRYSMFQEYNTAIRYLAGIQLEHPDAKIAASLVNKLLFSKNFQEYTSRRIISFVKNTHSEEVLNTYTEWQTRYDELAGMYQMSPQQLAEGGMSLAEKEKEVLSLERQLVQKGIPEIKQLKSPEWQDIAAALRPGEAAMDMLRLLLPGEIENPDAEVMYACCIITPLCEKPEIVFFKNGNEIESLFWGRYANEISAKKDVSAGLFADFWVKLSPFLSGIHTLYYSPDGIFYKINLATLMLPDGHYWFDKTTLTPVTTLRHLIERSTGTLPAGGSIVLAGNPDYKLAKSNASPAGSNVSETYRQLEDEGDPILQQLSPLPGSEREVKKIAEKAREAHWSTILLTGEQATETAIKQVNHPTILHLATHGYFMKDERRSQEVGHLAHYVRRNPTLRSMLFFSGAERTLQGKKVDSEDDGIFTAFEASVMSLDSTELVVLSACNTGLGKVQNGEGVIGLQRAFRMSGARSLVMTLWEVEDSVSALFMDKFYEGILGGKTKIAAFRDAQLLIKSKYPQPFFWGGFVLVNG